jgi:hypothetical protein
MLYGANYLVNHNPLQPLPKAADASSYEAERQKYLQIAAELKDIEQ